MFGFLGRIAGSLLGGGGIGGLVSRGIDLIGSFLKPRHRRPAQPFSDAQRGTSGSQQQIVPGQAAVEDTMKYTTDPGKGSFMTGHTGHLIAPWIQRAVDYGANYLIHAALRPYGMIYSDVKRGQQMPYVTPGESASKVYNDGLRLINANNRQTPMSTGGYQDAAQSVERHVVN